MLQFMRQRASSWIIRAVLAVIVLAFMFMGMGNFRQKPSTTAATVNDEIITVRQFYDKYYRMRDTYRQQLGGKLTDDMLKRLKLKEVALNQLISERLMLQQAAKLGLQVSNDELVRAIGQIAAFQQNGRFNRRRYEYTLKHSRLTPEIFESQMRQELLVKKLRKFIADSVKVSEAEAAQWYVWQHTKVKIKAVRFDPDNYHDIKPSGQELEAYFAENQQKYKDKEKISISYLLFSPSDFLSQVTVDPAKIQDYYDAHLDTYTIPKTVEARHILIKVDPEAAESVVEAKKKELLKIYDKIKAGKDFAAAARESSEGPSAKNGGKLGAFKKEDMVAPFAEKAFSMNEGEISEPVRTQFGWHLIKVEKINEAGITPFEQVKADIEKKLARSKAQDVAYKAALAAFDLAINKNSVKEAADELGRKATDSPLFTKDGRIDGINDSREMVQKSFDLYEGDISDVVEVGDQYCMFQVKQRVEPQVPKLETIKQRVQEDLIEELQNEKAADSAAAFLKSIASAGSLATAAEQAGLKIITTDSFGRRESIPKIGREPKMSQAAFQLNDRAPCADQVFKGSQGRYYVICLAERMPPKPDAFSDEKEKTMKQLLRQKQRTVFSSWLSSVDAASEITRNERVIDNT